MLNALELIDDQHLRDRGYFLGVTPSDRICPTRSTPLVASPPMADPRSRCLGTTSVRRGFELWRL
jgi:hypothetical protein